MIVNPHAPEFEALPDTIPVFPLYGVLLLPGGKLPLNIFEPRYIDMVNAAMAGGRIIGMTQPVFASSLDLQPVGCAGKITEFAETEDGRYLITLHGLCRYKISSEVESGAAYRQMKVNWKPYESDLTLSSTLGLDRDILKRKLGHYFDMEGLSCEWDRIEEATDTQIVTCLSMICPFAPEEKQALLEAETTKKRADLFLSLLDFALKCGQSGAGSIKTQH